MNIPWRPSARHQKDVDTKKSFPNEQVIITYNGYTAYDETEHDNNKQRDMALHGAIYYDGK